MESWEIGNLIYLGVLGAAVLGWYLTEHRRNLGRMFKQGLAWMFIFVAVIAAIGLWEDIRDDLAPRQAVFAEDQRIELPRAPDGHYHITLQVNGQPLRFVVDTGASGVVLTKQDAAKAGLDPDALGYIGQAMTANGPVKTAPVRLDHVALGPIVDTNLPAFVNGGKMDVSLLGMTYLNRFERIEISGGKLVLER
jgi:aspartyl protease family protein